jgi:hypothetical protein
MTQERIVEEQPERSLGLGLVAEALIALPVLLAVWWSITESGPWAWLVWLQLNLFKGFYGGYTFAFCFLVGIVVSVVLAGILRRLGLRGRPALAPVAGRVLNWWIELPGVLSILGLLGAFAVGMGLWWVVPALTAGPRTEVSAADLEAGERPDSRWLAIHGRALVQIPVIWTKGSVEQSREVAMVSEGWRPDQPVAVCLQGRGTGSSLPTTNEPTVVEGLVRRSGLPPLTRDALKARGLVLADEVLYLEVGDTPPQVLRFWGYAVVGGAGAILLSALGGLVWTSRRPPTPPSAAEEESS